MESGEEEGLLRSVALETSTSILRARQRAEEALEQKTGQLAQSLALMRATLESTTDGILVTDERGRVTAFNEKFLRMWRMPRALAAGGEGEPIEKFCERQLRYPARFHARIREIHTTVLTESFDLLECADGRIFERYSNVQTIEGRNVGRVWSFRDITGRRRVDEELRESRERLQAALAAAGTGTFRWNIPTSAMEFDENLDRLFGLGVGAGVRSFEVFIAAVHPEDRPGVLEECRRCAQEGGDFNLAYRIVWPDGSVHWLEEKGRTFNDPAGRPLYMTGACVEVTERKRAEELRHRLAAVVESSDDAIISKTLDGTITTWNKGAELMFGHTAEEAVGQSIFLLIPPERTAEEPMIVERLRRGERIEHYETVRRRKDGSRFDVSLTVSPIKDASGRVTGASKIARDITERTRTDTSLRESERRFRELAAAEAQSRIAAEQASRAKDHFIAALSHELRTPLTPVLAILSNLGVDATVPAPLAQDLEVVRRNVELEARLIDDLLDLTRITRGKLELHLERVTVDQLVENAFATCAAEIQAKPLSLVRDLAAPEAVVSADGVRLTQILWNLLKNAIKFTPAGGAITVRTRIGAAGTVTIAVEDTGPGIAADKIGGIFEAFEQGGREVTRQFGGLGLGLAISRAIAEAHHGTLAAASPGLDRGSTFTLTLPLATAGAAAPAPAASRPPAKAGSPGAGRAWRILLVEDHADTAAILARMLRRTGYEVISAATATAALDAAEQAMAEGGIDLVMSDLSLPDGSGLDLMRSLGGKYGLRGIALSGLGMESDREKSRLAGFARHLVKPIDIAVVRRTIAEMLPAE